MRGEAALAVDLVEAGDLGSLAGEPVLEEAPAFVLELEGLAGVSEEVGFAVDFLTGDVAGGRMLLRLPGVEVAGLPAGVLGLTGRVLVRLLGVIVEALPRDVPGLGAVVLLGVLAGVLGLAVVELAVLAAAGLVVLLLLGVDDRDGREARRGALRRSASAACCSFLRLLSMSLWCGACDPMVRDVGVNTTE